MLCSLSLCILSNLVVSCLTSEIPIFVIAYLCVYSFGHVAVYLCAYVCACVRACVRVCMRLLSLPVLFVSNNCQFGRGGPCGVGGGLHSCLRQVPREG